MTFIPRTAWCLLFACVAACRSVGTESAGGIRETVEGVIAADNARDLDAVMSCYAPDAEWLPPDEAAVVGHEALRARYAALFAAFQPKIALTIEEAWLLGDVAVVRGRARGRLVPNDGGDARMLDDKYLMLLRRDADDKWRIIRLMWNANSHA